MIISYLFGLCCLVATFWERAGHSVAICSPFISTICNFGCFWIWVLIVSVPGVCILDTFTGVYIIYIFLFEINEGVLTNTHHHMFSAKAQYIFFLLKFAIAVYCTGVNHIIACLPFLA